MTGAATTSTSGAWNLRARWHNFDPKGAKADYKTFDDIHYQYLWSSGVMTIQLTKGGNAATGAIGEPVGLPLIVHARDLGSDEAFEKAVHDVIAGQKLGAKTSIKDPAARSGHAEPSVLR